MTYQVSGINLKILRVRQLNLSNATSQNNGTMATQMVDG